MKITKIILALVVIIFNADIIGATTYKCTIPATTMLEEISNNLIKDYNQKKAVLKDKKALKSYALEVTETTIMPSLDAEYMAKQVIGRYHWNNSKQNDRDAFVATYKKILTDEYTSFLLSNQTKENLLKFYPSRKKSTEHTVVFATINGKKKKTTIGFYLHCVDNTVVENIPYKTWMIYDISVDNISLLDQFKATASSTVRNSGMPGLTRKMKEYYQEKVKKGK